MERWPVLQRARPRLVAKLVNEEEEEGGGGRRQEAEAGGVLGHHDIIIPSLDGVSCALFAGACFIVLTDTEDFFDYPYIATKWIVRVLRNQRRNSSLIDAVCWGNEKRDFGRLR